MTHWMHTETPFGNAVYQIGQGDDGPTIVFHGVGNLTAAEALTTNHQGETVPDWDAMKAEARRIAEDAGAPLARWYTPDPALTINGKAYTDSIWAERKHLPQLPEPYIFFRMGGLTDAAERKFGAWLLDNWGALTGGENGRASAIASARDDLRRANDAVDKAHKAYEEAVSASIAASDKLAALTGEARA